MIRKLKAKSCKLNRGMTYVELIVVLSIFAGITSAILFNYGTFQGKVDMKNVSSDIALKIVEAQKSSMSGELPPQVPLVTPWKPSYGIYILLGLGSTPFVYFADLDQSGGFYDISCPSNSECLEKIFLKKDVRFSALSVSGTGCPSSVSNLSITFKRPNSGPIITSNPPFSCTISYAEITISSSKAPDSKIRVYSSGRIQVI